MAIMRRSSSCWTCFSTPFCGEGLGHAHLVRGSHSGESEAEHKVCTHLESKSALVLIFEGNWLVGRGAGQRACANNAEG
jgi:hypothetical protein